VFNHYQRIRSRAQVEEPPLPTPASSRPSPSRQPESPIPGPSTPSSSLRRDPAPHVLSPRQPDPSRPGTSLSDGTNTEAPRIPGSDTDPSPELTAKWGMLFPLVRVRADSPQREKGTSIPVHHLHRIHPLQPNPPNDEKRRTESAYRSQQRIISLSPNLIEGERMRRL